MRMETIDVGTPLLHPVERIRPRLRALFGAMWTLARRRPLGLVAGIMLAADLAFFLIQIAVEATDYGFNGAFRLSLQTEMGVAQLYGMAKLGAAAYLLALAWLRYRSPVAALWSSALVYLALDDAFEIHERLGARFDQQLEFGNFGPVRGQDVGELMAYVFITAIAVSLLYVAERLEPAPTPSVLSLAMVPLVGGFLFFAVFLDIAGGLFMNDVIGIAVEDGGELAMMTVIFAASVVWAQQGGELAALSRSRSS